MEGINKTLKDIEAGIKERDTFGTERQARIQELKDIAEALDKQYKKEELKMKAKLQKIANKIADNKETLYLIGE